MCILQALVLYVGVVAFYVLFSFFFFGERKNVMDFGNTYKYHMLGVNLSLSLLQQTTTRILDTMKILLNMMTSMLEAMFSHVYIATTKNMHSHRHHQRYHYTTQCLLQ